MIRQEPLITPIVARLHSQCDTLVGNFVRAAALVAKHDNYEKLTMAIFDNHENTWIAVCHKADCYDSTFIGIFRQRIHVLNSTVKRIHHRQQVVSSIGWAALFAIGFYAIGRFCQWVLEIVPQP